MMFGAIYMGLSFLHKLKSIQIDDRSQGWASSFQVDMELFLSVET
jgi:hypothetical protein